MYGSYAICKPATHFSKFEWTGTLVKYSGWILIKKVRGTSSQNSLFYLPNYGWGGNAINCLFKVRLLTIFYYWFRNMMPVCIMKTFSSKLLEEITKRLVEGLNLDQIILFGSHAWGHRYRRQRSGFDDNRAWNRFGSAQEGGASAQMSAWFELLQRRPGKDSVRGGEW